MLYLVLYVLFTTGFGLVVKQAQHRGLRLWPVGAVNYVAAAACFAGLVALEGSPPLRGQVLITGIVAGIVYVLSFLFLIVLVPRQGISVPSAVIRLSQLLPVLYAMVCWRERPSLWQVLGLVLFCAAVPLLMKPDAPGEKRPLELRFIAFSAGLFLITGLCGVATRRFDGIGAPEERTLFLSILFVTSGIFSVALLMGQWVRPTWEEALLGILQGLCNVASNSLLLVALGELGGILVFPVSSAMAIVLTTVIAIAVWKEAVGPRALWGIALSSAAVVFLNLH